MQVSTQNFFQLFKQNYDDINLNILHNEFFNYTCQFSNIIATLTPQQKQENRKALMKVKNQNEFFDFCKNSHGIYFKCCLWAINSKLCKTLGDLSKTTKNYIFDNHHIICQYLANYEINNNISFLIDERYTLVRITYVMHYFLHAVRAFEYNYIEDYHFLNIVDKKLVKTLQTDQIFKNGVNKQAVKIFLQQEVIKAPGSLEKLKELRVWIAEKSRESGLKSGLAYAEKILNKNIKGYLIKTMHWTYESSEHENFTVTFEPRQFRIIRRLVIALHEKMPLNKIPNGWRDNQEYLEDQSTYLANYLLGKPKLRTINNVDLYYPYTSYKEWKCDQAFINNNRITTIKKTFLNNQQVNPPVLNKNVSKTLSKISPISKTNKQGDMVQDILMSKTTEWSYEYWFLHEQNDLKQKAKKLTVYPQQFENVTFLVEYLMDLIPPIMITQCPEYRYYKTNNEARKIIKRSFTNILKEKKTTSGQLRNLSAYGWFCKKIF